MKLIDTWFKLNSSLIETTRSNIDLDGDRWIHLVVTDNDIKIDHREASPAMLTIVYHYLHSKVDITYKLKDKYLLNKTINYAIGRDGDISTSDIRHMVGAISVTYRKRTINVDKMVILNNRLNYMRNLIPLQLLDQHYRKNIRLKHEVS